MAKTTAPQKATGKRYPNVDPAFDRLKQEMARLEGLKEDTLTDLRGAGPTAEAKARRARQTMAKMRPLAEKWLDGGAKESDEAGRDAALVYVAATLELRDALAGSARAQQVLESDAAQSLL